MTEYALEPLVIELNAPAGDYEVTVSIKSHSDTVFSIFEDSSGFVTEDREIRKDESTDIIFKTQTQSGIQVKIYCDGDLTVTAMAEYLN